jgi:hypothetical protein
MRINLILVYSMLSVELSIAWLKILLTRAHARAYVKCIFDRCMGAFINTPSNQRCEVSHYLVLSFLLLSILWSGSKYCDRMWR